MSISRRRFMKEGAVLGLGTATLAEAAPQQRPPRWDQTADVVIAGAGASGLCAAIMARDRGASVIVIDENNDIGGHAMVSGGRIPLGGGTSMQKKHGITDSADQVFLDHTSHRNPEFAFSDRDLVRVWADENAPTFEFLIENGVKFADLQPTVVNGGTVPRLSIAQVFSNDLNETIAGSPGSGLVRPLAASARAKGATFLLSHKLTAIVRESPTSGKVLGLTARQGTRDVNIQARKGVIIATGGHTSNVEFRRIFDPRLTEEYQVAGEPWTRQTADGEMLAMSIGASLWATANQNRQAGLGPITKTQHIGCRYGYQNLKWDPKSPVFARAGASGLSVRTFQDVILVNQIGQRFWNEMDRSFDFINACLGSNGNLGKDGRKANGGGPIWAIFDADSVMRENWDPRPPNVDLNGWFFSGDTLGELAGRIKNPYQYRPLPGPELEATIARYNSFVDAGKDADFAKPTPMFKVQKPPFYAAWSTPILHDTLTGLKINQKCQVMDLHGNVIAGLYCAGECAGGFALHGLPRVTVFGRIAGREARQRRRRRVGVMDDVPHNLSIVVWDVPSLITAGLPFTVKVGAKCSAECVLAETEIEVHATRARLSPAPLPGTAALYWAELHLVSPAHPESFVWDVTCSDPSHETATTSLKFTVAPPPEHTVRIKTTVPGLEIRLGRYRSCSDEEGQAAIDVPKGVYELNVWKEGYELLTRTVDVAADVELSLEVVAIPAEDEAYWM